MKLMHLGKAFLFHHFWFILLWVPVAVEDLVCGDIFKPGQLFKYHLDFIWVGFVGRSWLNKSWIHSIPTVLRTDILFLSGVSLCQ